jgi:hypothetical protein
MTLTSYVKLFSGADGESHFSDERFSLDTTNTEMAAPVLATMSVGQRLGSTIVATVSCMASRSAANAPSKIVDCRKYSPSPRTAPVFGAGGFSATRPGIGSLAGPSAAPDAGPTPAENP